MREFTRCVAWAAGLGIVAFAIAAATGGGLAQSDGTRTWLVLAAYGPFYFFVHAFHASPLAWRDDTAFLALALAVQFLYFVALVALVRYLYRNRRRARR